MRISIFSSAIFGFTTFSTANLLTNGVTPLKYEHPGQIFHLVPSKSSCPSGVLTNGNSTGTFKTVNGVNTYFAYPPSNQTSTAILYLTDIFGLPLVNNRLLGDSLAKAGFFVVMPDMFTGDAIPLTSFGSPTFNMTAWSLKHTPDVVDAIINSTLTAMIGELGVKKIGAVGYCFGGRFVARYLGSNSPISVGFAAHPSGTLLSEWQAIAKPISIAFGDLDAVNTPANRTSITTIFEQKNATFQTTLYSNAEHGFAVRTDLTIPQKAFAQEGAYWQALRWLDAWAK